MKSGAELTNGIVAYRHELGDTPHRARGEENQPVGFVVLEIGQALLEQELDGGFQIGLRAEQATTVTKAYLAEFILKAAAEGLTSYEGLMAAVINQLPTILSMFS